MSYFLQPHFQVIYIFSLNSCWRHMKEVKGKNQSFPQMQRVSRLFSPSNGGHCPLISQEYESYHIIQAFLSSLRWSSNGQSQQTQM